MAGQERVDLVNLTIDELISTGHSEASTLAEWKDAINESWADLLELIDTRNQLLTASYDLLKYGPTAGVDEGRGGGGGFVVVSVTVYYNVQTYVFYRPLVNDELTIKAFNVLLLISSSLT